MFLKEAFYAHRGWICLNKKTVKKKITIVSYYYNLNNSFLFENSRNSSSA